MSTKKVEIIEPVAQRIESKKKLNVCAYARVSTGSEEQKDSFISQKEYYEELIRSNSDYNFVGVFADEGISGTTDKRPGFQRMIRLAEQGFIDIIYTKSLSRFSRNVMDLKKYCGKLKDHNVDVIFETENLRLLDSSGALLFNILSAISEMEVENTRERVNWKMQIKMEHGELVGQANPLGYDVVDNQLIINKEEAEIVRYIFRRYIEGVGGSRIARELCNMGVKTKKGNVNWCATTVIGIIKNEKYTGVLLQGKTCTVGNTVNKKRIDNNGNARKYKVENHHEAIIDLETWMKAQEILEKRCITYADGRRKGTTRNSNLSIFTSKLVCAYCGKNYVKRIVHAGTKYAKVKWNCSTKCKQGKSQCPYSKAIDEDYLRQAVVMQIKSLIDDDSMFYLSNERLGTILKQSEKNIDLIEEQINKCNRNIETIKKKKSKLFDLLLEDNITEEQYYSRSALLDEEMESSCKMMDDLSATINYEGQKGNTALQIRRLINEGKAEGFNEELFNYIIDKIIIGGKRLDGTDDPRSLHFDLNVNNLQTDMVTKIDENGIVRYTCDSDIQNVDINSGEDTNSELCTFYNVSPCGDSGIDVTLSDRARKIRRILHE